MSAIRFALALSLAPLLASCVTVQSGAKPSSSTHQFASFETDLPAGGNWGISETDHENEKIAFSTASYAFMASKVTTRTSLAVAKVSVPLVCGQARRGVLVSRADFRGGSGHVTPLHSGMRNCAEGRSVEARHP